MPKDPDTMRRLGRLGGYARASRHDGRAMTEAARSKFLDRFIDEVDPRRELDEGERMRRALAARRYYYGRLSYLSSKARSARARKAPPSADAAQAMPT